MLLVINDLRGTHMHADIMDESNFNKPGTWWPAQAWFNKMLFINTVSDQQFRLNKIYIQMLCTWHKLN